MRTRYLILFLDENQQPLHSIPFRIGLNGGTGAALGEEVRALKSEVEQTFFQLRHLPPQSLTPAAHCLSILELHLGFHKSEGKAPSLKEPGTSTIVERSLRHIELIATPLTELLVPKSSQTGKLIQILWHEHKHFATKYNDDLAPSPDEDAPF